MSPYQEAYALIKRHPGTGGAGSFAKLLLSLYNDLCGYSFAECIGNLDSENTALALRVVNEYAKHGETEELRAIGKELSDNLYPRLWEMGLAMRGARQDTRRKWEADELAAEDAKRKAVEEAVINQSAEPQFAQVNKADAVDMLAVGEDGKVMVAYFANGDWGITEFPLGEVRDGILAYGTVATDRCPESGYMLSFTMDKKRVYYAFTDYDAREAYRERERSKAL